MKKALCCILFILSFPVVAANTNHEGVVTEVLFFSKNWGTYSNTDGAVAAIYMSPSLPNACGTGLPRVLIDVKHPLYQSVVSAALAAKFAKATVRLNYLSTCSVRSNSWDFGLFEVK